MGFYCGLFNIWRTLALPSRLTNEKFGAADQKVLIPAVVNMVKKDVQEIEEMKKVKKFE